MKCTIQPTRHAKDKMIERGISKQEVLDAITKGAKRRQEYKIVSRYRWVEVVFIQKPCHYYLITVYWER
ncbi:MAG: DUF4258 domain-containing protein [DPANN group archaeon]|nr:DUF4258 domain-containing protein [DPANN group archaeon]